MKAGFPRLFALVFLFSGQLLSAQESPTAKHSNPAATTADQPERNTVTAELTDLAALPDAPEPQNSQQSNPPQQSNPGQSDNSKISASGKLPAILAPQMTRERLTAHDKLKLYVHQAFNPVNLLPPTIGAGYAMINPPDHYPHEWRGGAEAYGRHFGDIMARRQSEQAAQFLTQVALHEDPRYLPSASHNPLGRMTHAMAFTLVDKSDSGHSMPAFSNFAGAAASGFVGMAYLPSGTYTRANPNPQLPGTVVPFRYDDATHAGQRSLITLGSLATSNLVNEFCPEWGPPLLKLHLPFVHPPCAERIAAKHP